MLQMIKLRRKIIKILNMMDLIRFRLTPEGQENKIKSGIRDITLGKELIGHIIIMEINRTRKKKVKDKLVPTLKANHQVNLWPTLAMISIRIINENQEKRLNETTLSMTKTQYRKTHSL